MGISWTRRKTDISNQAASPCPPHGPLRQGQYDRMAWKDLHDPQETCMTLRPWLGPGSSWPLGELVSFTFSARTYLIYHKCLLIG